MKNFKFFLLSFCLLMAFANSSYAVCMQGPTLNVTTTNDTVDVNPGDGICADSDDKCSLRAAVMEANASSASVTINVPAGTYNLGITYGAEEDASASNDLDITNVCSTTITGAGTGQDVIINASTIAHRVFDVIAGGNLKLNNLTITKGYSSVAGGGIRVASGATLNLDHVIITDNDSVLGGGIYNEGTITGNLVSITSNTSQDGGGIYLSGSTNNSVTLTRSLIFGNSATNYGGGVYNGGNGSYDSPVGGTIYLGNVTIGQNSAQGGAGVYLNQGSRSYFVNCTIAYNTSLGAVSGVGIMGGGANSFDFLNTLVFQNTGTNGVGNCYQIYKSSSSLNWPGLNDSYFVKGVVYGHNIEDNFGPGNDQSYCFGNNSYSSNILLDASLTTDPALAGVGTYKLQTGSAAIDAGDTAIYATLDVFGTARPVGTAPDIGAYEFTDDNEPPTVPVLSSPSNGASVYGTSVRLFWQKSTDPEGGQVIYILQIASDNGFTTNLREFYVDENGNLLPAVLLPFFGLLGWLGRKRGKRYLIGLALCMLLAASMVIGCSGSGGSSGAIGDEKTISYQVSGLEKGKTYYWRVIAQDEQKEQSDPSEVRSFTVY